MLDQLREAARAVLAHYESVAGHRTDMDVGVMAGSMDALRAALDAPQAEAAPKAGAGEASIPASLDTLLQKWADARATFRRDYDPQDEEREMEAWNALLRGLAAYAHPAPSPAGVVEARALLAAQLTYEATTASCITGEDQDGDPYVSFGNRAAIIRRATADAMKADADTLPDPILHAAQEPPRAKPAEGGGETP